MKCSVMLVCAMMTVMGMSASAGEKAGGAGGEQVKAEDGKGKHPELTEAQREERTNKLLERIKAKDEAKYKELMDLKEKDPKAFKMKLREVAKELGLGKEEKGPAEGKGHGGKGKAKGNGDAGK